MVSFRTKKKTHSKQSSKQSSLSSSVSTVINKELNTKWLNNIVQGKGLIDIIIRKKNWNELKKIIRNNPNKWIQSIQNKDSDILFYLFKSQKFKLIWFLHKKYPFKWQLKHLSYLIAFCPHICSRNYKVKHIKEDEKGLYYINIFNDIAK